MAQKDTDRGRCTHFLKMAEGGTCQDTERNRPSKAHSRSRDGRGRDLSGYGKKKTKQGALTLWRQQREGLVRTGKEKDRARGTHILEISERGTCQYTERNQPSEVHSQTGDSRGRGFSGDGKKPTERGTGKHSLSGNGRRRDLSGHGKKKTGRGALTP